MKLNPVILLISQSLLSEQKYLYNVNLKELLSRYATKSFDSKLTIKVKKISFEPQKMATLA
ncbi:hypothetical protein ACE1B6_04615 [Aerosakkonemataceae cyanobacterium BLCC-F154]|uniref:Uncharacterized protein n=1 Tax=Floridaenema fluviatile BLCC-F154 TaxID=3153640 RepID=A0ABV4Y6U9_9CYAN